MGTISRLLGHGNVNPQTVLLTFLILAAAGLAGFVINRYIWKLLERAGQRFSLSYETSQTFARSAALAVWIVAAMLILSLWGVSMSGVWTLLVSAAAVIGVAFLAVWAIVSNVTASLFLTVWRPFHLGQTVEILPESLKGRVAGRNMMFTSLSEEDGATLYVPNNLFFQKMFRVSGSPAAYRGAQSPTGAPRASTPEQTAGE
jgi:small-conductance mechanosensitive channel